MNRLIATTVALMAITGTALAQQPMPMPGKDMPSKEMPGKPMPGKDMGPAMNMGMDMKMMPNATDPAATAGYKAAMMKMMTAMPSFTGNADTDFMTQMRPHHQAAIDMAKVVLANGKDAETKKLAQDIITAQEKEIAVIDAWLKKKGT
jgi:uncharacterized protein (DUF305 family)